MVALATAMAAVVGVALAANGRQDAWGEDLSQFLVQLRANPRATMDQVPRKEGAQGAVPLFSQHAIETRQFVQAKRAAQEQVMQRGHVAQEGTPSAEQEARGFATASAFDAWRDNARTMVDNAGWFMNSLSEMEEKGLLEAELKEQPWSASYWPLFKGQVGQRYGDRGFNAQERKFVAYKKYVEETPAKTLVRRGDIKDLSPGEKYDLLIAPERELVGGGNTTDDDDDEPWPTPMTQSAWSEGQDFQDAYDEVETWMGICHGWAPAAYMLPRPRRAVTVKGGAGEDIVMYPHDIKALGTLLWASGSYETRFIGSRCNEKDARRDNATGRLLDQQCVDTNPATFHLALVNQIGLAKRSFILDVTYDYEVWNQPVLKYEIRYFNPSLLEAVQGAVAALDDTEKFLLNIFVPGLLEGLQEELQRATNKSRVTPELLAALDRYSALSTRREWFPKLRVGTSTNITEMAIPIDRYADDMFKQWRSPAAKYLVGVEVRLSYMVETEPNQAATDGEEIDAEHRVVYRYDLELDETMDRAIGGEWYSNLHPDFMWTPTPIGRAVDSAGSPYLFPRPAVGSDEERDSWWHEGEAIPRQWVQPAQQAARRRRVEGQDVKTQPLAVIVEELFRMSADLPVVPVPPGACTDLETGGRAWRGLQFSVGRNFWWRWRDCAYYSGANQFPGDRCRGSGYRVFGGGYSANQACCACGGGDRRPVGDNEASATA